MPRIWRGTPTRPGPGCRRISAWAAGDFQAIEPEGGYEVLSGDAGRDQALLVQSGLQYVDYALEVPQAGLYNLLVEHHPMDTAQQAV